MHLFKPTTLDHISLGAHLPNRLNDALDNSTYVTKGSRLSGSSSFLLAEISVGLS